MTKLVRYNVHLSPEQIKTMRRLYERDGIAPAEQIRRALDAWLKKRLTKARS